MAKRIVLVGGSGFVGRYIVNALHSHGHRSVVLTRQAVRHRDVSLLPGAELVQANVHDPDALQTVFSGADAVISMAGILNQAPGSNAFMKVHVELVEKIVAACRATGVRRLVHISALNAGNGKSHYLETKGQAEQVVNSARDLDTTIFQPSVIFGPGDSFFNRFAGLVRMIPVMPLACADAKLQPVFAGDVARAVAGSVGDPGTYGRTFELGGPNVYSLIDLVRFTARCLGLKRIIFPQPDFLSVLQGAAMGLLPNAPFSLDNYRSLKTDNVCQRNGFEYFRISPASIEALVPDYLDSSVRQRRLADMRRHARRG